MSRYALPARAGHSAAVGYERMTGSFFALVIGPDDASPFVVNLHGLNKPIRDPRRVVAAVAPYATVWPGLAEQLTLDRHREGDRSRPARRGVPARSRAWLSRLLFTLTRRNRPS